MTDNRNRDSFPDAADLKALLDLLQLNHDPVIQEFLPEARTPRFVQTLRRSERVVEAGNNVRQKALCRFHIGLFYLHWQESVGAAHCFQRAGRYWQLTPLPPLVSLASLAEGCAWHQACDNEAAMVATMQAERQLGRLTRNLRAANPTERVRQLREFAKQLTDTLELVQATLLRSAERDGGGEGIGPPTTNMEND